MGGHIIFMIGKLVLESFLFFPNWHIHSMQFHQNPKEFYKNWQADLEVDMEMQGVKTIKDHLQEQSGKTYQ